MTAPFRQTYTEESAINVIEEVEKSWKIKWLKQPSTLGQGLLSFGIFHPNTAVTPQQEDVVQFTKKLK